jgi:hypothetical protein
MILFTPEGKVGRVRYDLWPYKQSVASTSIFDEPVVDNLFLLVGQRGKIPAPDLTRDKTLKDYPAETDRAARERAREPLNWMSGTSRWVVIGSQSGRVATVPNTYVNPPEFSTYGTPSEDLRSSQIIQARALTRETTQATGR